MHNFLADNWGSNLQADISHNYLPNNINYIITLTLTVFVSNVQEAIRPTSAYPWATSGSTGGDLPILKSQIHEFDGAKNIRFLSTQRRSFSSKMRILLVSTFWLLFSLTQRFRFPPTLRSYSEMKYIMVKASWKKNRYFFGRGHLWFAMQCIHMFISEDAKWNVLVISFA